MDKWLKRGMVLLAPMAGVTDSAFRVLCKEQGCDMVFTEMVSAKGLHFGGSSGKSHDLLKMDAGETPCVVQIFGSDPAIVAEQAKVICDTYGKSVAWIDINMGCPAPKITANGEGSALMKTPELAAKVIERTAKAVPLPVTVKCRAGWDDKQINVVAFAKMVQESGAQAITVHPRTRMQYYSGRSDWTLLAQVKEAVRIPVIGNGDIRCAKDAKAMLEQTGVDAVMIGRGAQGNPWLFAQVRAYLDKREEIPLPTAEDRVSMALRHARMCVETKGERAIVEMRKHVAWYLAGLHGAARARAEVNHCVTYEEMEKVLSRFVQEDCAVMA